MRLKRRGWLAWAAVAMVSTGAAPTGAAPSFAAVAPARSLAEVFNYERFGAVSVYRGRGRPRDVVLLMSGDGGWDAAAEALAERLADMGALVAGIDGRHYREELEHAAETCVSPDSDLENLSHYLQSKLQFKKYLVPILVGYESDATLVYATLAQAPEGLFKGAISIGFSPDLDLKKALCDGAAMTTHPRLDAQGASLGSTVSAAERMPGKWIALQGDADRLSLATVREFVADVPGAEMVSLPKIGADYPIESSWMPQYEAAYAQLAGIRVESRSAPLPAALADLPLTVVPSAQRGSGQWFGVFLSGDGGWVGLDKGVSAELAKHDIPIIGWDSLKYFWTRRTPEGASRDLDRVLRYYSHAWGRSHALLIGYSQGADTMPFMVNRLPAASRELVGYTTLVGISDNALWEFHVATWLGNPAKGVPTAPELERWSGSPYLCIYGESDADAACEQEAGHDGTALELSGGHHFGGGYARIADEILSRLPSLALSDDPTRSSPH